MGSHYIPVNSLKLDGVSIDPSVYCPANGYPDPNDPETLATYCPAGGYVDPVNPDDPWVQVFPPYVPDPVIPETPVPLSDESIVLITSSQLGGKVELYFNTTSGNYIAEIYGADNALLNSLSKSSGALLSTIFTDTMAGYAASDGSKYFKVIVKPATAGQSITQCRISSSGAIYPIIEAYFNTPNLQILNFDNTKLLKKCWMCETMNSLNTTSNTHRVFQNTISLEELTMPVSMNAQTNLDYWFAYSKIPKVILPASMNSLASMQYTFQYKDIWEVKLPDYVTTSTFLNLYYCFYETRKFKRLTIPDTWNPTYVAIDSTFQNCYDFESFDCPSTIVLSSMQRSFQFCRNFKGNNDSSILTINNRSTDAGPMQYSFQEDLALKKIEFLNSADGITRMSTLLTDSAVEEFIFPKTMNGMTSFTTPLGTSPALRKLTLPSSMSAMSGNVVLLNSNCVNIEEISKCDNWGNLTSFSLGPTATKLKIWDQPNLILPNVSWSGFSSLEYFNIDFSNSFTTGGLTLTSCNLSAAELNRIMTALPTVDAGSRTAAFSGNPGYATCTKSIATAKGWLVP